MRLRRNWQNGIKAGHSAAPRTQNYDYLRRDITRIPETESKIGKDKKDEKEKMIFKEETEEEKLLRYMRISPRKKLEWLRKMHEFTVMSSSKHMLAIRWKLRKSEKF